MAGGIDKRVVIVGGAVAGLAAAIALARRGAEVVVVERDPGPATDDGDEAFVSWERRNVAQFRQPHGFSARSRSLLLRHAPDVVDRLAADGVTSANFFKMLAPQELWEPGDDAFDSLNVRRPAFELALRRTAEAQEGITFACPANVTGIVVDASAPVRVRGVRLEDGTTVEGDVVLDCGGGRTLIPGWLAAAGAAIPLESQDCDVTYHTRYFRLLPSSPMEPAFAVVLNSEIDRTVDVLGFPGDKRTFALCLASMPGDEDVRDLRHNWAWDAVALLARGVADWVDPANATPINDVAVMSGRRNVRRRYVVDGEPLVLGLLAVGDALCTTNPAYGWGASMALTYAFAAVDALADHGDDLAALACAYEAAIGREADAVYRESAAMDRLRIYRWRGIDIPDDDREEMERQALIARGVGQGATRDPVLGRAFLRRSNLIERPDQVLEDPEVVARATAMAAKMAERAERHPGPTRDDVIRAIEAARPSPAAV